GPPPATDRADGKSGRIVIGADAHPTNVVGDVIDAVRHSSLQLGINEVVNVNELRVAFGTQFPAVVLKSAYELLLFRVNAYNRLIRLQESYCLRVDVLKLRVAIDVVASFFGLAVGL